MNRDKFLLRPDVTFLNHGSFGACPREVFEHYQQLQRQIEAQPVQFLWREYFDRMSASRAALAAYVGAHRDDLVFVPNATTGLNIVARSLDLQPGEEVLSTDHEYGALDRTWRFLAGKKGFRYIRREIPLPLSDPQQVVDAVWQGRTARTRVLFISHITSPTALTFPVKQLIDLAREAGIISIIDGAHVPGHLDLDLNALGADFYSGNCHKWLMAPKGAAFLHARSEMQHLVEPLIVSWGYEAEVPGPSRFIDHLEWTGTRDPSAWLAVPRAIRFVQENSWDTERERCHRMLLDAHARITELTRQQPICPASAVWFRQMATLPLPPGTEINRLKNELYDQFQIEIPILKLAGKGYIRLSAQGYNQPEDYDRLLEGLTRLLGTT
jgi:isopenicillin-N epimerase